jgi:exopolyphosphatase/guanosine-5'-triphosphate,3'-diphosphate pyrophosphatase
VLSGDEEAALSYDGAIRNLRTTPTSPVLVIDIGGGSTELILGDASGPFAAQSMDMGSVRMHERYLTADPPTAAQVAACVADIDAHLDACPVPVADAATVVAVAGTALSITAGVLDLPTYDKRVIDQAVIAASDVHAFVDRLVAMPIAERLDLGWMHPGRADVLGAGGLVLSRVLRRCSAATLVASEADILDGIAWSMTR